MHIINLPEPQWGSACTFRKCFSYMSYWKNQRKSPLYLIHPRKYNDMSNSLWLDNKSIHCQSGQNRKQFCGWMELSWRPEQMSDPWTGCFFFLELRRIIEEICIRKRKWFYNIWTLASLERKHLHVCLHKWECEVTELSRLGEKQEVERCKDALPDVVMHYLAFSHAAVVCM